MPGLLWYQFREGNRSEYLAQYILSALGIAVPIPRQEDIGADFHCTLGNREGNRITFHAPFLVQVKSHPTLVIPYGGIDERGRWKREEVDWLFSQELPLLIGIVDKQRLTIALYSTSNMWAARYTAGHCGQVRLLPDTPGAGAQVPMPTRRAPDPPWPADTGDGHIWDVPLGPPITLISIDDLEDPQKLVSHATVLLQALHLDQQNITYRRLNVHYSTWLHQPPQVLGVFYAWNSTPGANTTEQLRALAPIAIALAHNFKAQHLPDQLRMLKPIFRLIPPEEIEHFRAQLTSMIPELFEE
jgi:hypothetical protein